MASGSGMLTARGLASLKPGEWVADPAARGAGRLQVRKLASGELTFYYRYTTADGVRDRLPLGTGLDLREARSMAAELSRRYQGGERNLRDALEREADQKRQDEHRALQVATERRSASLGALLEAYVGELRRAEKPSADKVEKCLRRHVQQAWPTLWAKPAVEMSMDDLIEIVARLVDQEKLREADKLRAYLRAAYASAIRARQSAKMHPELRRLNITSNPARDLMPVEGGSNARQRNLSLAELQAYWNRIKSRHDATGALLRFHLLTGTQRITQLARIQMDAYDANAGTILIRDTKGRRKAARMHLVPLLPGAQDAMQAMRGGQIGPFLFTATAGQSGADYPSVRHHLNIVVEDMLEAGELTDGKFTAGDLRRTVETRLAAAGVSKEIRGHLQSHGLGGVQDKHYDRYEYLDEKRAALQVLLGLVESKAEPARIKRGVRRPGVQTRAA
jgi:hypothetical protein